MGAATGRHREGSTGAAPCSLLPVRVKKKREKNNWMWGRREGGKRKEKEKEGKEKKRKKKKKIWIFSNLKFFGRKIKDNLWSWKIIIFV
jgi:hypothetical protein